MSRAAPALSDAGEAAPAALPHDRFVAVVRAHYDFVYRLVRRFGLGPDEAEDAAQQVSIVAWRRLADIEEGRERAFLAAASVRVVADFRRSVRRRAVEPLSVLDEQPHLAAGPEELLEVRRARELLDAVLETMPYDLRCAFVLFEVEELTMTEMALVLEVPRGTVASRLRRAREWFTTELSRRSSPPSEKSR